MELVEKPLSTNGHAYFLKQRQDSNNHVASQKQSDKSRANELKSIPALM